MSLNTAACHTINDLLADMDFVHCSSKPPGVELTGFEPVTPALPVRCATSCATAPKRSPRPHRGALATVHEGQQ
jgi:hypothetical protein